MISAMQMYVWDGSAYHKEMVPLPFGSSNAALYIRELAPSLYENRYLLRRANLENQLPLTLLIPGEGLPEEMKAELHGGTLLGEPISVVDGIDGPMLAYPLRRMKVPS